MQTLEPRREMVCYIEDGVSRIVEALVGDYPRAAVRVYESSYMYHELGGNIEVLDSFTRTRYGVHPSITYRFVPE
jgi:hypothetical protein